MAVSCFIDEGEGSMKQLTESSTLHALPVTDDDPFSEVSNIFIELTSKCNMKCKFCPYPVLKREKQDMPHECVLKILNEIENKKKDITFHVLGEPLLNKRFFEYAKLCDEKNINYWLVTNGLLLTPSISDKLFSLNNLKNLEISFHTMTSESFTLRGCNISFEDYMKKIEHAVFSEKRYESDIKINIDIMYDLHLLRGKLWNNFSMEKWKTFSLLMREWSRRLHRQYPEARARWPRFFNGKKKVFHHDDHYVYRQFEDIPASLFEAFPPHITWLRWEIFPNVFVSLKKFFFFTKNEAYLHHALGGGQATVIPASHFTCSWPCHLAILSNGDITFCCLDYEGELSCGNIRNMTLEQAIRAPVRRLIMTKPDSFSLCRLCKGELFLAESKRQGE